MPRVYSSISSPSILCELQPGCAQAELAASASTSVWLSNTKEVNLTDSLIHPVVQATWPCIDYAETLGGIIYRTEGGVSPRKYTATQDFGAFGAGLFSHVLFVLFLKKPDFEQVHSKPPAPKCSWQSSAVHVFWGDPCLHLVHLSQEFRPSDPCPQLLSKQEQDKKEGKRNSWLSWVCSSSTFSCEGNKEDARNP